MADEAAQNGGDPTAAATAAAWAGRGYGGAPTGYGGAPQGYGGAPPAYNKTRRGLRADSPGKRVGTVTAVVAPNPEPTTELRECLACAQSQIVRVSKEA